MKIIVKCGGKWKGNKKAEGMLQSHADYMKTMLPKVAEKLGVKLPRAITLRPMRVGRWNAANLGLFVLSYGGKCEIALFMDLCLQARDKGRSVIDHECAHLADVKLNNNWGHGETFKKIHSAAYKLRPRRKSRRKKV